MVADPARGSAAGKRHASPNRGGFGRRFDRSDVQAQPLPPPVDRCLRRLSVEPYAREHGEDGYLDVLRETLESCGPYSEQRRLLVETHSLPSVVEALADELVNDACSIAFGTAYIARVG